MRIVRWKPVEMDDQAINMHINSELNSNLNLKLRVAVAVAVLSAPALVNLRLPVFTCRLLDVFGCLNQASSGGKRQQCFEKGRLASDRRLAGENKQRIV